MAFISQNVTIQGKEEQKTPPSSYVLEKFPHLKLDKLDIEILLSLIKESTFKGKDIQVIYDLILKLQNYYEQIT